jgi:hypothetical protein
MTSCFQVHYIYTPKQSRYLKLYKPRHPSSTHKNLIPDTRLCIDLDILVPDSWIRKQQTLVLCTILYITGHSDYVYICLHTTRHPNYILYTNKTSWCRYLYTTSHPGDIICIQQDTLVTLSVYNTPCPWWHYLYTTHPGDIICTQQDTLVTLSVHNKTPWWHYLYTTRHPGDIICTQHDTLVTLSVHNMTPWWHYLYTTKHLREDPG